MWNWCRGAARVAGFQCEEKPMVCGDGLAPLSSVELLATLPPRTPLQPHSGCASTAELGSGSLPLRPSHLSPGLCAHG